LDSYIVPLILGWAMSFLNVIIGGWIITKEFKKQGTGFINKVLLSLVARVFVIVGTLFIFIYYFKVEKISLAVVLFFFYIIFLVAEISYLSGNTNK
jgi:hypothetical protein